MFVFLILAVSVKYLTIFNPNLLEFQYLTDNDVVFWTRLPALVLIGILFVFEHTLITDYTESSVFQRLIGQSGGNAAKITKFLVAVSVILICFYHVKIELNGLRNRNVQNPGLTFIVAVFAFISIAGIYYLSVHFGSAQKVIPLQNVLDGLFIIFVCSVILPFCFIYTNHSMLEHGKKFNMLKI